ncbi:6,7-dimethyl-8-ribityllumazine synthase [Halobaculum halobium]|uniref:6,7-dimethyl-8-ribityllumazine synthase n=1 Tax=Halobaculum halobium TaxID=3032281 RepID=A0ABD5TAD4_9EURY|nr:6,7-dimethyl-8-ribityllumazine synthase [Halobaculum sp. SYNS20]
MTETTLGLVVARYYASIAEAMEESAREAVAERSATVAETVDVPGAYDTPLAADRLARRDDIDAVAVVGTIVSGDTDHDQVIGQAIAAKLADVSLDRDTPVTFGVSGPGQSGAEARERAEKGAEAASSAVDLAEGLPAAEVAA